MRNNRSPLAPHRPSSSSSHYTTPPPPFDDPPPFRPQRVAVRHRACGRPPLLPDPVHPPPRPPPNTPRGGGEGRVEHERTSHRKSCTPVSLPVISERHRYRRAFVSTYLRDIGRADVMCRAVTGTGGARRSPVTYAGQRTPAGWAPRGSAATCGAGTSSG